MGNKKIYIIGAGASRKAGLPLQQRLLRDFLNIDVKILRPKDQGIYLEIKRAIKYFLKDIFFYPKKTNLHYWPSFSDIFTILDSAILNKESLSPKYKYHNLLEIRKQFVDLLRLVLYSKSKVKELDTSYIKRFLDCVKEDQLTIICLNWDHIFDLEIIKLLGTYKLDYGTDIEGLRSSKDWKPVREAEKRINLLKLHGSVNWFYCPNCKKLFTTREKIHQVSYRKPCRKCNSGLDTLIITPTFLKDLNNIHLQNIWFKTGQEIRKANHLVFIGYSFPEADFELRYLLKKNFNYSDNLDSPKEKSVDIVDYDPLMRNSFKANDFYKIRIKRKFTFYQNGEKDIQIPDPPLRKGPLYFTQQSTILRYLNFFKKNTIKYIHLDGFEQYINRL